MGEVYRARDTRLERHVAVKVLPEAMAGDPACLARFEQVRGQAVDARSDLFAFGAVRYELLGGRQAFRADTAAETGGNRPTRAISNS